jgi:hypothetical protein
MSIMNIRPLMEHWLLPKTRENFCANCEPAIQVQVAAVLPRPSDMPPVQADTTIDEAQATALHTAENPAKSVPQ